VACCRVKFTFTCQANSGTKQENSNNEKFNSKSKGRARRRQDDNIKNRAIYELYPTSSGYHEILDFCEHIDEHQASIPAGTSSFKERSILSNSSFN
jgi:hypothetical protein